MRFMIDGFMNIHSPSLARNWKYLAIGHLFASISERRSQKFVKRGSISARPCSNSAAARWTGLATRTTQRAIARPRLTMPAVLRRIMATTRLSTDGGVPGVYDHGELHV
jgi:hypothetical protein